MTYKTFLTIEVVYVWFFLEKSVNIEKYKTSRENNYSFITRNKHCNILVIMLWQLPLL